MNVDGSAARRMMPIRAVSDETIYRARSLAEIRGRLGERAMFDGFLGTVKIDNYRAIHIAELSRQSIIDSGAEHLGFGGYFLFETQDSYSHQGIKVLAKVATLDAAFEMLDIWNKSRAKKLN